MTIPQRFTCALITVAAFWLGYVTQAVLRIDQSIATIAANSHQPFQLQIAGFSPEAQRAMDTALQPQTRKKQK